MSLLQREGAGKVPDEMKPLIGTYYANFGRYKNTPLILLLQSREV